MSYRIDENLMMYSYKGDGVCQGCGNNDLPIIGKPECQYCGSDMNTQKFSVMNSPHDIGGYQPISSGITNPTPPGNE